MLEDGPLVPNELDHYDALVVAYIHQGYGGEAAHRKAKEQIITYRRATVREASENWFGKENAPTAE